MKCKLSILKNTVRGESLSSRIGSFPHIHNSRADSLALPASSGPMAVSAAVACL